METPESILRRLEFKVVRRLDGLLFGDYTGMFYGPSLDLAEVREYQPGDEVRRIDWNVTARRHRLSSANIWKNANSPPGSWFTCLPRWSSAPAGNCNARPPRSSTASPR